MQLPNKSSKYPPRLQQQAHLMAMHSWGPASLRLLVSHQQQRSNHWLRFGTCSVSHHVDCRLHLSYMGISHCMHPSWIGPMLVPASMMITGHLNGDSS